MHTVFSIWFFDNLQLRGGFPHGLAGYLSIALTIVLAVAGVIGVGFLYAKEAGRLGILPRAFMATIRIVIVAVVAFLLFRPVWVIESQEDHARPVSVLIDVSQSMDTKDVRSSPDDLKQVTAAFRNVETIPDRPKRIEIARAALYANDTFKQMTLKTGPLDVYTFGSQRIGRSSSNTDWLKDLTATETQTKLVESAFDLINRDDNDAPSALFLITDGRENAGPKSLDDLARECSRRKIPIYVYGVGSSSFTQLRVKDVIVPETLFVDDLVAVPVRYSVK